VTPPPDFTELLRALTLGTARREIPANVREWVDAKGAVDPTADDGEYLLAAVALIERSHRLRDRRISLEDETERCPPETLPPPEFRFARGLALIFDGTYPGLMDEAVELIHARNTYLPAPLLPALHLRAAALAETNYPEALRYIAAGGERGKWLARQHPDWHRLVTSYDFASAFRKETQPGQQARLLRQWRHHAPDAAREALQAEWKIQKPWNQELLLAALEVGLEQADISFLLAALKPKRKGVRRIATRLLLRLQERATLSDWTALARSSMQPDGKLSEIVRAAGDKEVLERYGGTATGQRLPNRLLSILPPDLWEDISGLPLPTFWTRLRPLELRDAGRAIVAFADEAAAGAYVSFLIDRHYRDLPPELTGQLINLLPAQDFTARYDRALEQYPDLLSFHGPARVLALQRKDTWSERLTKALLTRLVSDLQERHLDHATQRQLAEQWRSAIPRIHPATFPWLRQQLHAATERYDAFGKLATEMLQVTRFRREFYG
jgi:hypothetical protein